MSDPMVLSSMRRASIRPPPYFFVPASCDRANAVIIFGSVNPMSLSSPVSASNSARQRLSVVVTRGWFVNTQVHAEFTSAKPKLVSARMPNWRQNQRQESMPSATSLVVGKGNILMLCLGRGGVHEGGGGR